jgi:tetratricopeptide (TPR) repeat protein
MIRMLLGFCDQAVRTASCLGAIAAGTALVGQTDFRLILGVRQHPAGSNVVTVQKLAHVVPEKARKEIQKAEKARIGNRTEEAIGRFNKVIRMYPEYVSARNNLAAVYLKAGKPGPAVEQLEEAVKIDPHNSMLYMNLTLGYAMLSRLDAAERAARTAIELDRTRGQARLFLGLVLIEQGKYTDEALKWLDQSGEGYPLAHLLAARILSNAMAGRHRSMRSYERGRVAALIAEAA